MRSTPLDKVRHDRNRFDCGVTPLNNYLRVMANQQSARDNTRTYILEDRKNPGYIIGFYTLTMTSIDLSALPENIQKKHHNVNAAGLIARLAVDKRYTARGFGDWLLVDALNKLLSASKAVGFPIVVVDAKDGTAAFYEKFGFVAFTAQANKLFISVASIRKSI